MALRHTVLGRKAYGGLWLESVAFWLYGIPTVETSNSKFTTDKTSCKKTILEVPCAVVDLGGG